MVANDTVFVGIRVLHQDGDSNRSTRARSKDFSALFSRLLALGALVAPEIENIDRTELVYKSLAEAVHGLAIEPTAGGDARHDALVLNAIGCPAERANVLIVNTFLKASFASGCICIFNFRIKCRVMHILIIIVLAFLAS